MQNFDKIYQSVVVGTNTGENRPSGWSERFLFGCGVIFYVALFIVILLIPIVLAIGLADRAGISPRLSFPISALCLAGVSGLLTWRFWNGGIIAPKTQIFGNLRRRKTAEPLCKMLTIRQKDEI